MSIIVNGPSAPLCSLRQSARNSNTVTVFHDTAGDAVAIDMPMTVESVVIYLGIILAGCAACTVADSFAPPEIAARLRIAACKLVFTQACSGPSGSS